MMSFMVKSKTVSFRIVNVNLSTFKKSFQTFMGSNAPGVASPLL